MSSPFGSAGVFAPNVGEKNARTALIEYATNHAWLLDLTATRAIHAWRAEVEQDPNQFLRAAADGGHWVIWFDYEVKGDPEEYRPIRKWDNTLRSLRIWHSSWVDAKGNRTRSFELKNYHQANSSRSILWDITDPPDGEPFKPLRKRAEQILRDPDLAIWLAVETAWKDTQRDLERRKAYAEKAAKRRAPLNVTIPEEEFRSLCRQLREVSYKLSGADGLTDLPASVAQAEALIAKIRGSLESR